MLRLKYSKRPVLSGSIVAHAENLGKKGTGKNGTGKNSTGKNDWGGKNGTIGI
jgi:hypothetical protein